MGAVASLSLAGAGLSFAAWMMTVRLDVEARLARLGEEVGAAATGRTWLRARQLTKVKARMQLFQRDVPRNAGGSDANPQ